MLKILRLLILLGLLAACSPLDMLPAQPTPVILAVAPPGSTPTPTPFQPIPVTPVFYYPGQNQQPANPGIPATTPLAPPSEQPAETRTWADYPGPSIWPDMEVPPPVGILPQPAGQTTIILIGADENPSGPSFRTDSMMLVTLNPQLGTANVLSIPRDLYVYVPGWTMQRINTAYIQGGFDLLQVTYEYNFGVRPDHFVMIDFWSFVEIIDSLGGIKVNVAEPLTDQRDGYGEYTVEPGLVHMDGNLALWYARSRLTTSDVDRGRRQQEVLQGMFNKLMTMDALARAPQLYNLYYRSVTTDMTFDQMAVFLPLAAQLRDPSHIRRLTFDSEHYTDWMNFNGAQVLLPVRDRIVQTMRDALNSP